MTRDELAGRIDRVEDALCELRGDVVELRDHATAFPGRGAVALELERAVDAIGVVSRLLARAYHEASEP